MKLRAIYDIEVYPNVFTLSAVLTNNVDKVYAFEISERRNDFAKLARFIGILRDRKIDMVGFNNINYDYPVLHHMLRSDKQTQKGKDIAYNIYLFSDNIIKSESRFDNRVRETDWIVPQIDLMMIHHFDNKAMMTSLKKLEFVNRSNSIQDLPYSPGTMLEPDQINELLHYNAHDVTETLTFYNKSEKEIEFREAMGAEYARNFMNYNDTKIGSEYMIIELEKHLGKGCCYTMSNGGRSPKQTIRNEIVVKDLLFSYLKFESEPFKAVHQLFQEKILRQSGDDSITKGVFTTMSDSETALIAPYAHKDYTMTQLKRITVRNEIDKDNDFELDSTNLMHKGMGAYSKRYKAYLDANETSVPDEFNPKLEGAIKNLNVKFKGIPFVFGTGGLHASVSRKIYRSTKDKIIIDLDVTSFYPSMAISNKMHPAQYSGDIWYKVYSGIRDQRLTYAKGTVENAMLKLALNGIYGKSNDVYSPFYDPAYTMQTCINGQLLLCMLTEKLAYAIDDLEMIQANTDGITVRIPRSASKTLVQVAKDWSRTTRLQLESAIYSAIYVRDVNNYIAVYAKGGVKGIGDYRSKRNWSQNHSALIIPKVIQKHIETGVAVEELIRESKNPYDFMLLSTIKGKSRLIGVDGAGYEVKLQKNTRYYVSNTGIELYKQMPLTDKEKKKDPDKHYKLISLEAGQKVMAINNMSDFRGFNTINYDYYLDKINDLLNLENA